MGKQLHDARVAKGWSPELAARETKIRVDRLHDLEVDDYSNFSSPTYARGFVRTYARALGLDEYKILRQLDNKLPEDDNATFINDGGVPYIPEPSKVSKPLEIGRGVYLAGGVGGAVLLLIGFILIQSYRAGYFAATPVSTPAMPATNALPIAPETETARALPADNSAPPVALPVDNQPVATTTAPAAAPVDTNTAPRALPVNLADLNGTAGTPAAKPAPAETPATTSLVTSSTTPVVTTSGPAPAVEPAPAAAAAPSIAPAPDVAPTTTPAAPTAEATVPTTTTTPPRALPVDLGSTGTPASDIPAAGPAEAPEAPPAPPHPHSVSARDSNSHSTVDVAAADSATDTLIASTASAEPPPPTAAQVPTSAAPTGEPGNAPAATPVPETSSPETSAPSSLDPAGPAGTAGPRSDSALTGAPAASDTTAAPPPSAGADSAGRFRGQRLVLTASHDSFVRVIALDGPDAGQVRYASTLHSGQSISFNDRKYSINVANPSAIDIALDGINYGPHSEDSAPDTFTVESHTP